MKKGNKKTTKKYVTESTFEKHMRSLAEAMDIMIRELKQIHEDNKYFRASISNLNLEGLSYDRRIENLNSRI